jgi:hypothetical protein
MTERLRASLSTSSERPFRSVTVVMHSSPQLASPISSQTPNFCHKCEVPDTEGGQTQTYRKTRTLTRSSPHGTVHPERDTFYLYGLCPFDTIPIHFSFTVFSLSERWRGWRAKCSRFIDGATLPPLNRVVAVPMRPVSLIDVLLMPLAFRFDLRKLMLFYVVINFAASARIIGNPPVELRSMSVVQYHHTA